MDELEAVAHGSYDTPALVPTLSAAAQHELNSDLRVGDLMLHTVADRLEEVGTAQPLGSARRGTATTHSVDTALLVTLAWEVMDSAQERWHVGDLDRLALLLAQGQAFGIAFSHLQPDAATGIADRLSEVNEFVSALDVDLGNPLHVSLCGLPSRGWIRGSEFLVDRWRTDDPFRRPELTNWEPALRETPLAPRYMSDEETEALPDCPRQPIGERGAQSAAVLAARTSPSHVERVMRALDTESEGPPQFDFSVSASTMPSVADAVVDERKLRGYALNFDSDKGKHKARRFSESLGIEADDWEYLAAQLKEGLGHAQVYKVQATQYGVSYHCVIEVLGLNGKRRAVRAAWQIKEDGLPHLTSTYIDTSKTPPDALEQSVVIDADLTGDQRYEALYEAAHATAKAVADATVPTPMNIDGDWIQQGAIGFAWVTIRDLRTGFARWLTRGDLDRVSSIRGEGAIISAPYRSYDQCLAYAEEFASALHLNGQEAGVTSRLD